MKLKIAHKLALSSVLIITASVGLVTWLFYERSTAILVDHALEDISNNIDYASHRLQTRIQDQNEDVLYLANIGAVQNLIEADLDEDPKVASAYEVWIKQLENTYRTVLRQKSDYLAVRLIDKNGFERISLGREKNQLVSPIGGSLQNKSQRAYVRDTLELPPGEVYLSEINLNREFGKVSVPHQKVLRNATLIVDKRTGTVWGLMVISVEIGRELQRIQTDIQDADSDILITNDEGDYLLHPDSEKTFGFDLGNLFNIRSDLPQIEPLYSPVSSERRLILKPEYIDGLRIAEFNRIYFDPYRPERFIAVGVLRNFNSIVDDETRVLNEVLILAIVLTVLGALAGVGFSISLTRPINRVTRAVNEFALLGQSNTPLPVDSDDEVGVLAQSFESMMQQVEDAQHNMEVMNQNLEDLVAERTRSLQEGEIRVRTIVDNIVDGLLIIDKKGVIQEINPAAEAIFGYKEAEVAGKNIKMLMPEPYHSEHDSYLTNYLQTGEEKIIGSGREVEGLRKDGSIFPLDLAVSSLTLGGEQMFSGIVRDITERRYVDKMKNEFISTVSHELRTPLTSIRGSLGLISGGAVGEMPEAATEMLNIANSNTERLLLLINDILDIQKIESGQLAFRFRNIPLISFLEKAIKENAAYGLEHGVEFVFSKKMLDANIFADEDRMMQVMANLLSNAAKFSPEGEKVVISAARHHNNCVRISVTDHGSGIPEDFQPQLFDKFTQSDSSDSRQKGGTGLGLSITKLIAEKHGGQIDFISRVGVGSTFFVELPELTSELMAANHVPEPLPHSHLACVLIIEDDPDIAILLKRMLVEGGFNSDIARDAEEAHQRLKEKPGQYKAITLDLMLPGEDGISFLNRLRQEAATQDIPVVVVSVTADEAKRDVNGGAIGVIDWLQKPIDSPRLIRAIKQAAGDNKLPRVLHVEDEADVHKVVGAMLSEYCEMTWTTTLSASREVLEQETFDLVLLDIGLPDGSGLDLLEVIERRLHPPRVVIFSAQDVSREYADKVSAVLIKSKTSNLELAEIIRDSIASANNQGNL